MHLISKTKNNKLNNYRTVESHMKANFPGNPITQIFKNVEENKQKQFRSTQGS